MEIFNNYNKIFIELDYLVDKARKIEKQSVLIKQIKTKNNERKNNILR